MKTREGQPEQPVVCVVCNGTGWLGDPYDSGIGMRCQCGAGAAADDSAQPPLESETRVRLQRAGSESLRPLREVISEIEELFQRDGLAGVQGFSITVRFSKSSHNLKWGDLKLRRRSGRATQRSSKTKREPQVRCDALARRSRVIEDGKLSELDVKLVGGCAASKVPGIPTRIAAGKRPNVLDLIRQKAPSDVAQRQARGGASE